MTSPSGETTKRKGSYRWTFRVSASKLEKKKKKKEKKRKEKKRRLDHYRFSFFPKIGCSICHSSSYLIARSSLSRLVLQFKYFSSKLKPSLRVICESQMMSRGCWAIRARSRGSIHLSQRVGDHSTRNSRPLCRTFETDREAAMRSPPFRGSSLESIIFGCNRSKHLQSNFAIRSSCLFSGLDDLILHLQFPTSI